MASVLIAVIYLAFISMGLPDALLGAAWPSIQVMWNVPVSWAGIITFLISLGTVLSSVASNRLIQRFGTGWLTVGCTALVTLALFGFSLAQSFWVLCVLALPYGLGAGSIDAALNNYVALHYKSRHMSWIHFFWGLGAAAGPTIMGWCLTGGATWNSGYRVVGLVQLAMTAVLLLTLPLWKKTPAEEQKAEGRKPVTEREALRLPGAKAVLGAFFCYCAMESTTGMWASSYMVAVRGIDAQTAASWAAVFYVGITAGRFLCGFIADKLGDRVMVRLGQGMAALGAVLMLLPLPKEGAFAGLLLIGLGCAPVYPCMLHQTPKNFGADHSQALMGLQMACAYVGSTLMSPLFGVLAGVVSLALYPVYLLLIAVTMFLLMERVNRIVREKN